MSANLTDTAVRALKTFIQAFVAAVTVTSVTFDASELHLVETSAAMAGLAALTSIAQNLKISPVAFNDGGNAAPVEQADPGVVPPAA